MNAMQCRADLEKTKHDDGGGEGNMKSSFWKIYNIDALYPERLPKGKVRIRTNPVVLGFSPLTKYPHFN